jgi:hypothetical protein
MLRRLPSASTLHPMQHAEVQQLGKCLVGLALSTLQVVKDGTSAAFAHARPVELTLQRHAPQTQGWAPNAQETDRHAQRRTEEHGQSYRGTFLRQ